MAKDARPEALRPTFRWTRGGCGRGHPIARRSLVGKVAGLDTIAIPDDASDLLQRQALDIFARAANAGYGFAECLSSVLLSGMDWARVEATTRALSVAHATVMNLESPYDQHREADQDHAYNEALEAAELAIHLLGNDHSPTAQPRTEKS